MAMTDVQPTIVESIAIKAPIAAVYAAVTTPEQLTKWWGSDESYHTASMEADVRPGGAWKTTGNARGGGTFSVSGIYRAVEPPSLVEFTWRHDWSDGADQPETLVRYDLVERDGVTTITVMHSGFITEADYNDHLNGWKTVLGSLHGFLTPSA